MLRKLISLLLAALLACAPLTFAEETYTDDLVIENVPPAEPIVTESEYLRVTAEYLPEADLTRHTAELLGNPAFADGTALTAEDILFSLYVYFDPDCSLFTYFEIPGLESYQRQVSPERLAAAPGIMAAIEAAGADHVHTESDGWTQSLQETYWTLHGDYAAACAAEFPKCAQAVVDYCAPMLTYESQDVFGRSASEISADEGLLVAYAMQQWAYATADDNILTANISGKMWNLDDSAPTIDDFAAELSLAYDGDLAACWAVESTGTYWPTLPPFEETFLLHFIGDEKNDIPSISGIRMTGERTIEIDFEGIHMHSSPFSMPVLSLSALGDMEKWSPENGLYGHDFGDVSAIEAAGFDGVVLLESPGEIIF